MFRIRGGFAGDHRIGQALGFQRFFTTALAGPQHIRTDPSDNRGQPATEIADIAGIGAGQTQPCFLYGVVGVGERAEHPVGDRPQMSSVLLEPVGQKLLVAHGSSSISSQPMTSGQQET